MTLPPLTGQQQVWLLLPNTSSRTMSLLFKYCQNPVTHWLYATTVLDSVKEQGPLVANITDSQLYQSYQQEPEKWQGHLIYTKASSSELLKHLRALLIVHFYGEEKGILNYFHPQVASYFFRMPEKQLPYWLGPIDLFAWYGGTHLELANGQQTIHYITRPVPHEQTMVFMEDSPLTSEQEQLLGECQAQHELWEWCGLRNISYPKAWNYQQEGLQLGFFNNYLTDYIDLRLKNSSQSIPKDFPIKSTAENKLSILKTNWNS